MKDQEMEKAQQEKEPEKKNNFKTKIILYVVGIAIIFVYLAYLYFNHSGHYRHPHWMEGL